MAVRRATQARIAIAPDAKRQSDFATPMALATLSALLSDESKAFYKLEQTRDDVIDCSGEELYKRILTGEIGDLSVEINAAPPILALFASYAMGVSAAPVVDEAKQSHAITELPFGEYQPPVFSLVFGFLGAPQPLLLRACVVNSFAVKGAARGRVTGTVNLKFAKAEAIAEAFAFPACFNSEPVKFGDCLLSVNNVALDASLLRSFEYSFNNKILTDAHAFTNEGTEPTRLEREDRRERTLKYSLLGDNRDAVYLEAEAGVEKSFSLQIGKGAADKITFAAPRAQHELDGGGLQRDGRAGETNIRINATPLSTDNGASTTTATAINAQATAYLLTDNG